MLPRRSELSRKRAFESSSQVQVLGANMDVVGVVVPVDRPLDAAARRAYQREWHQKVVGAGRSQRAAERLSAEHDPKGGGKGSGKGNRKGRAG